jgi:hypothetical protein
MDGSKLGRRQGGRVRALGALMLMLGLFGSLLGPNPAYAARALEEAPLDLAAMVLTPTSLAGTDLDGYVFLLTSGEAIGPWSLTGQVGRWTDQVVDEEILETLEDDGLRRGYKFEVRLLEDPDDPPGDPVLYANASVHEFADDDGAAAAFTAIDELSAASAVTERVAIDEPIGDETLVIRGDEYDDVPPPLAIVFRSDRLIAVMRVGAMEGEPEVAESDAQTLAALLCDRMEAGLDEGGPGLANHVVRLADDAYHTVYEVRSDKYLRVAGEDLPLGWESAGAFADRVANTGDAIDAYELSQFIQEANIAAPDLPYQVGWTSRVYRFADDEAAADWLDDRADDVETSLDRTTTSAVGDVKVIQDAPVLGDESFTVVYTEEATDGFTTQEYRIYARVGAVVIDVSLGAAVSEDLPIEALQALAEVQVACLGTTDCLAPVLLSDAAGQRPTDKHRHAVSWAAISHVDLASRRR